MERHDGGGKGYLSREEFTSAAQDIFACVPGFARPLPRRLTLVGAGTWLAA